MEFQKIMHEWKRMCAATSFCEVCPLKNEKCWATSPANMIGDSKSIEAIILAWAKEHPEPVYPTWEEYFIVKGLLLPNWNEIGLPPYDMYKYAERALDNQIPADIAQKLGIEPKEG